MSNLLGWPQLLPGYSEHPLGPEMQPSASYCSSPVDLGTRYGRSQQPFSKKLGHPGTRDSQPETPCRLGPDCEFAQRCRVFPWGQLASTAFQGPVRRESASRTEAGPEHPRKNSAANFAGDCATGPSDRRQSLDRASASHQQQQVSRQEKGFQTKSQQDGTAFRSAAKQPCAFNIRPELGLYSHRLGQAPIPAAGQSLSRDTTLRRHADGPANSTGGVSRPKPIRPQNMTASVGSIEQREKRQLGFRSHTMLWEPTEAEKNGEASATSDEHEAPRLVPRTGQGPSLRDKGGQHIDQYLMRLLRVGVRNAAESTIYPPQGAEDASPATRTATRTQQSHAHPDQQLSIQPLNNIKTNAANPAWEPEHGSAQGGRAAKQLHKILGQNMHHDRTRHVQMAGSARGELSQQQPRAGSIYRTEGSDASQEEAARGVQRDQDTAGNEMDAADGEASDTAAARQGSNLKQRLGHEAFDKISKLIMLQQQQFSSQIAHLHRVYHIQQLMTTMLHPPHIQTESLPQAVAIPSQHQMTQPMTHHQMAENIPSAPRQPAHDVSGPMLTAEESHPGPVTNLTPPSIPTSSGATAREEAGGELHASLPTAPPDAAAGGLLYPNETALGPNAAVTRGFDICRASDASSLQQADSGHQKKTANDCSQARNNDETPDIVKKLGSSAMSLQPAAVATAASQTAVSQTRCMDQSIPLATAGFTAGFSKPSTRPCFEAQTQAQSADQSISMATADFTKAPARPSIEAQRNVRKSLGSPATRPLFEAEQNPRNSLNSQRELMGPPPPILMPNDATNGGLRAPFRQLHPYGQSRGPAWGQGAPQPAPGSTGAGMPFDPMAAWYNLHGKSRPGQISLDVPPPPVPPVFHTGSTTFQSAGQAAISQAGRRQNNDDSPMTQASRHPTMSDPMSRPFMAKSPVIEQTLRGSSLPLDVRWARPAAHTGNVLPGERSKRDADPGQPTAAIFHRHQATHHHAHSQHASGSRSRHHFISRNHHSHETSSLGKPRAGEKDSVRYAGQGEQGAPSHPQYSQIEPNDVGRGVAHTANICPRALHQVPSHRSQEGEQQGVSNSLGGGPEALGVSAVDQGATAWQQESEPHLQMQLKAGYEKASSGKSDDSSQSSASPMVNTPRASNETGSNYPLYHDLIPPRKRHKQVA